MGQIFAGQTQLTIKLSIGSDISGWISALIKYIKPDKTTGNFVATIDTGNQEISYIVTADTDIDQVGEWTFWAKGIYSGGNVIVGESKPLWVFLESQ